MKDFSHNEICCFFHSELDRIWISRSNAQANESELAENEIIRSGIEYITIQDVFLNYLKKYNYRLRKVIGNVK